MILLKFLLLNFQFLISWLQHPLSIDVTLDVSWYWLETRAIINHQQSGAWRLRIPLWIPNPRLMLSQVQLRGGFPRMNEHTNSNVHPQMPSLFWLGLRLPLPTSPCFREQLNFQFLCLHVLSSFQRMFPCFWLLLFCFSLSILAKSFLINVPSPILFNYSSLLILTLLSQSYFLSLPSCCFTHD